MGLSNYQNSDRISLKAKKQIKLYAIFHLNLAYSSIEEEKRAEVIKRCYWPLLRLARKYELPIDIEASGYTLETIDTLDPGWLAELRRLTNEGSCEFIGSGYSQMIGPLVPAELNRANQRIGLQVYKKLLGVKPRLALVNEQAYSAGLVRHYLDAGYEAIVMDWDNPSSHNDGWDPEWRYMPQYALGPDGERIPVIWSKSVPFQKFQRYAHGDLELGDYLTYLRSHIAKQDRAFAVYANDTEIFDFRPGRYNTEPPPRKESEWTRIGELFLAILEEDRFQLIRPGRVLDLMSKPGAGELLRLESPEQPTPVKKQDKYNITRWAVTGRDNLRINTECCRLYRRLLQEPDADAADWKELCYLWSSDFRTHITEKRWMKFSERLESMKRHQSLSQVPRGKVSTKAKLPQSSPFKVNRRKHILEILTPFMKLRLNLRRGLAIDGAYAAPDAEQPLLCSLQHGHFDDIALAADFYTGHLVLEIPGRPKITDLNPVEPQVELEGQDLIVEGIVNTLLGNVIKKISIPPDRPEFIIQNVLEWETLPLGALHLGHITLNPEAFDSSSLFYRAHNGGFDPEIFFVGTKLINHLTPVMPLVSASQGLGVTEGIVEIGDKDRIVRIEIDRTEAALTGHIVYHPSGASYLFRLVFSASEVDDTCQYSTDRKMFPRHPISIRVDLSPSGR
jgi:hypothetical protein